MQVSEARRFQQLRGHLSSSSEEPGDPRLVVVAKPAGDSLAGHRMHAPGIRPRTPAR